MLNEREQQYADHINVHRGATPSQEVKQRLAGFQYDTKEFQKCLQQSEELRKIFYNRSVTVYLDTSGRAGHLAADLPAISENGTITTKYFIGQNPAHDGQGWDKGAFKETEKTKKTKDLLSATIPVTEETYSRLAILTTKAIENPLDYDVTGRRNNNCIKFMHKLLVDAGIENGLHNKFDFEAYQKMKIKPINIQFIHFFEEFKQVVNDAALDPDETKVSEALRNEGKKQAAEKKQQDLSNQLLNDIQQLTGTAQPFKLPSHADIVDTNTREKFSEGENAGTDNGRPSSAHEAGEASSSETYAQRKAREMIELPYKHDEALAKKMAEDALAPDIDLRKPIKLGGDFELKPEFDLFSNAIIFSVMFTFDSVNPVSLGLKVGGIFLLHFSRKLSFVNDAVEWIKKVALPSSDQNLANFKKWQKKQWSKYDAFFETYNKKLPLALQKLFALNKDYINDCNDAEKSIEGVKRKYFGEPGRKSMSDGIKLSGFGPEAKQLVSNLNIAILGMWKITDRAKARNVRAWQSFSEINNPTQEFFHLLEEILIYPCVKLIENNADTSSMQDLVACTKKLAEMNPVADSKVNKYLQLILSNFDKCELTKAQVGAVEGIIGELSDKYLSKSNSALSNQLYLRCGRFLVNQGSLDSSVAPDIFHKCFQQSDINHTPWAFALANSAAANKAQLAACFEHFREKYNAVSVESLQQDSDQLVMCLKIGKILLAHPDLYLENDTLLKQCGEVDEGNTVWLKARLQAYQEAGDDVGMGSIIVDWLKKNANHPLASGFNNLLMNVRDGLKVKSEFDENVFPVKVFSLSDDAQVQTLAPIAAGTLDSTGDATIPLGFILKLLQVDASLQEFDAAFHRLFEADISQSVMSLHQFEAIISDCLGKNKMSQETAKRCCDYLSNLYCNKVVGLEAAIDDLSQTSNQNDIRIAYTLLSNLAFIARAGSFLSAEDLHQEFCKMQKILQTSDFENPTELACKKASVELALGNIYEARNILSEASSQQDLPEESLKIITRFSAEVEQIVAEFNMNITEVCQLFASYLARFFGATDSTHYLVTDSLLEITSRYFQYYSVKPEDADLNDISIFLICPLLLAENVFQYQYKNQTTNEGRNAWFGKMLGLRFATVFATVLNLTYHNVRADTDSIPANLFTLLSLARSKFLKDWLFSATQYAGLANQVFSAMQMGVDYYKQCLGVKGELLPESHYLAGFESLVRNPAKNIYFSYLAAKPVIKFLSPFFSKMISDVGVNIMSSRLAPMLSVALAKTVGRLTPMASALATSLGVKKATEHIAIWFIPGLQILAAIWAVRDIYWGRVNYYTHDVLRNVASLIREGKYQEARRKLSTLEYDPTLDGCPEIHTERVFVETDLDFAQARLSPSEILERLLNVAENPDVLNANDASLFGLDYWGTFVFTPGCGLANNQQTSYLLAARITNAFLNSPCNGLRTCDASLVRSIAAIEALSIKGQHEQPVKTLIEKMCIYARQFDRSKPLTDEAYNFLQQVETRKSMFYQDIFFRLSERLFWHFSKKHKWEYVKEVSLSLSLLREFAMHQLLVGYHELKLKNVGSMSDWFFKHDKTFVFRLTNYAVTYLLPKAKGASKKAALLLQISLALGFASYYLYNHASSENNKHPGINLLNLINLCCLEVFQCKQLLRASASLALELKLPFNTRLAKRFLGFFGQSKVFFVLGSISTLGQMPLQYPDFPEILHQTDLLAWIGEQLTYLASSLMTVIPAGETFSYAAESVASFAFDKSSYLALLFLQLINSIAESPLASAGIGIFLLYAFYTIFFSAEPNNRALDNQDDPEADLQQVIAMMENTPSSMQLPDDGAGVFKLGGMASDDAQASAANHHDLKLLSSAIGHTLFAPEPNLPTPPPMPQAAFSPQF